MKIIRLICLLYTSAAISQIGLVSKTEQTFGGYTLFHPNSSTSTYLVDEDGLLVFEWPGTHLPGVLVELLPDGRLLRTGKVNTEVNMGGIGGYVELIDKNGSIQWSYEFVSPTEQSHHDLCVLPNGNLLLIVLETIGTDEAIQAGRNPSTVDAMLWSEKLVEIKPIGNDDLEVVWEWRLWDHLVQDFDETKSNYGVVSENPGKIDVNHYQYHLFADWIHMNSVDYNPLLDQIVVSSPWFNEIWIIDHSTTTLEASTGSGGLSNKGGDLLFRWGNPAAYKNSNGGDRMLFGQHDAQWQFDGQMHSILLFNNGPGREGSYSTIEQIDLSVNKSQDAYLMTEGGQFEPNNSTVIYGSIENPDFYSSFVSGVQKLSNGNYYICQGAQGRFFELDNDLNIAWEYINPVNPEGILCSSENSSIQQNVVFRSYRYDPNYTGLPNNLIGNPIPLDKINCPLRSNEIFTDVIIFPSPFNDQINIESSLEIKSISIRNLSGKKIYERKIRSNERINLNMPQASKGIYIITIEFEGDHIETHKIIKN